LSRREALASAVGLAAGSPANTVRDRLWLWGHPPMLQDAVERWALPSPCYTTLAEGAQYLSIPNGVMVRPAGAPDTPYRQLAVPLRPLRRLVWSVVGPSGATEPRDRDRILKMAAEAPNVTGVMMDDFFFSEGKRKQTGRAAALSVDEVRELAARLKAGPRKLDLWVVAYYHLIASTEDYLREYLKHFDVLTFWTWRSDDLVRLQPNFEGIEKLVTSHRKVLGCYFWDFAAKKPVPLDKMQHQCELGLKWLKEGRLDGMLFLSACFCDLELENVEWTRRWIQKVGDQKLPGRVRRGGL
jgi:hypothetical protein